MLLKRMMPALLYDGKSLLKTVKFKRPSYIGDPINAIKIYNDKEVDELVFLDINASRQNRTIDFDKLKSFAAECFMPFAYGGGVKTVDDFQKLYGYVGAEKVIVNSLILENPAIVKEATKQFGAQAVVGSVDYKINLFGKRVTVSYAGHKIKMKPLEYCLYLQNELGVGELFVTSIDKEGTWNGFDAEFLAELVSALDIPVIAHGGAGKTEDIRNILYKSDASAAALGSMTVYQKKGMGVLISFPKREEVINE